MNKDPYLWTVIGVSFALRAALLLAIGPNPHYAFTSDSPSYVAPAQNLRFQRSFSTLQNQRLVPELYRTPGYPIFLAPFLSKTGDLHYRVVQWVQILLNSLSAGLVYLAALIFWRERRAALAAGSGLAFDFVNAIHCTFILTDILFVFLMSALLLFLVKRSFFWAGLMTALAAFVRPIGVYYCGLLSLMLWVNWARHKQTQSGKRVLVFVIVALLPVLAWIIRNHEATGRWTFSTLQDANIYVVRTALVEMERKHIPYEKAVIEVQRSYAQSQGEQVESQWATRYLLIHWRDYARVMAKDMVKLLTGNSMKIAAWALLRDDHYDPNGLPVHSSDLPMTQARELAGRHPVLGKGLVLYLLFLGCAYLLAFVGFWISWREKGWEETLLLMSSIFYFALITLGVDAQARYRLPIMPALFFFAGGGFKWRPPT